MAAFRLLNRSLVTAERNNESNAQLVILLIVQQSNEPREG